jgi:hypothetical protein
VSVSVSFEGKRKSAFTFVIALFFLVERSIELSIPDTLQFGAN